MGSLHGFLTAHWDHEPGRDGALPSAPRSAAQRFRPLLRGRGHRSAMSLPEYGSWRANTRKKFSDVSWGHEPPLGSAGVPPASSPGVPPGFRDFEFFPGGETPPEPAGGTPALRFMGSSRLE